MPYAICLAANLQPKPFQHRHREFIPSAVLCSALRSSASEKSCVTKQRALALVEVYNPGKKKARAPLTTSDVTATLEWFVYWGFNFDDVTQCVKNFPQMLTQDFHRMEKLFQTFTAVGFTSEDIKSTIMRFPRLIRCQESNLLLMSQYFKNNLNMSEGEFVRLILKRPSTLTLSVEENIVPTCEFFISDLEVGQDYLKKISINFPQLLACSLEEKIKPITYYFVHELGIPKDTFVRKMRSHPTILGRSLTTIKSTVRWLKITFDYSNTDTVRFLCLGLTIFQYSLPTLQLKVDNLCAQFNLSLKQCGTLIKHYPHILSLSIQNINNTIHFITDTIKREKHEIVRYPRILSSSLEKKIKPRYEFLSLNRVPHTKYALGTLYTSTNEGFEKFVLKHTDNSFFDFMDILV